MSPLSSEDIHLYCSFYNEIHDPKLISEYELLLSAEEKSQQKKFRFDDDRKRYLVTRALVRTVLSRYSGLAPEEWEFDKNENGKPCVSGAHTGDQTIRFNLSHTKNLIVLAVSRSRDLGVDVENYRDRIASMQVAKRFFSQQEFEYLSSVPVSKQQKLFFEYWTFKEAYLKARGIGISDSLEKTRFRFADDESVDFSLFGDSGNESEQWKFWQFSLRGKYLIALCAEQLTSNNAQSSTEVSFQMCEVVPLLKDGALNMSPSRFDSSG